MTFEFEIGGYDDGSPWVRIHARDGNEERSITVSVPQMRADQVWNEAKTLFENWWEKLR